jgi:hypothetical protein
MMEIANSNDDPLVYQICVDGLLDDRWADWFDGLTMTQVGERETMLTICVPDQATLRGVLNRVWDLNLPVISVTRVAPAG